MQATELETYIGKTGLMRVERGTLKVPVEVTDAKHVYGSLRFKVRPHVAPDGSAGVIRKLELGSMWVLASRVQLDKVTP